MNRVLRALLGFLVLLFATNAWAQSTAQINGTVADSSGNALLALGDLCEEITVEAAAPLVDVRSAGIGEVVEQERIVELPLQGARSRT